MNSAWNDYLQSLALPPLDEAPQSDTRFFAAHDDDALLVVSGEDATRFLQSQLSSDVSALTAGNSQLSSYSSAKGLVYTTFRVYCVAESRYYLRLSRSLAVTVGQRLKKFILRDRVDLDIDESLGVLSLVGESAAQALKSLGGEVPEALNELRPAPFGWVLKSLPVQGTDGTTLPHFECLVSNEALPEVWSGLSREWPATDSSGAELSRILSGEAQLTQDASEQFVAQSLNLHQNGGISFKKGCYPGQEQVAKTQYRGRLRSQLFRLEGKAPLAPGEGLYGQPDSQSAVATVINSAPAGDRHFALAVVRLKAAEKGTLFHPDGQSFDIHSLAYPDE